MGIIKYVIKKIIPSKYHTHLLRIKNDLLDGYSLKSYSQEGEDLILNRIFETQEKGFYVDIGAFHPKRFSNTYFFYKRGWRGINIEPNPDNFKLFKKHRKRDINLQIGISDRESYLTYYMFNEPALNTFDRNVAEKVSRNNEIFYKIGQVNIKVERLEDLLNMHLPKNIVIDFMSIDTEGHDINVIESNDWNRFRPKVLLIEDIGKNISDVYQSNIHIFLTEKNYYLFAKTVNTLIYKDSENN